MAHRARCSTRITRRQWLGALAAAVGTALATPMLIPATARGTDLVAPPSQRIRMGLVGCGNHGVGWNLREMYRWPDCVVVAVCDVDTQHLENGRKSVDGNYAKIFGKDYKPCATYGDFRELVRRKDIDAIANCTPDHWHVLPSLMAAKCGKDIMGEKPLTLFIHEGRVLSDTVVQHKRVFQTASENRSIDVYFRIVELVRGGAIGRLKHVEVHLPLGNTNTRVGKNDKSLFTQTAVSDPPPQLNYDMWLGQAPQMPYVAARVHGNFRWNLAFSGGVITDWGATSSTWPNGPTIQSVPGRWRWRAKVTFRPATPYTTRPAPSRCITSMPMA